MRPLMGRGRGSSILAGRTVIPGLIDSHIYATVAGLSWNAELHWEMTRTLADGTETNRRGGEDKAARDLDCRRRRLGADAIRRAALSDARGFGCIALRTIRCTFNICAKARC